MVCSSFLGFFLNVLGNDSERLTKILFWNFDSVHCIKIFTLDDEIIPFIKAEIKLVDIATKWRNTQTAEFFIKAKLTTRLRRLFFICLIWHSVAHAHLSENPGELFIEHRGRPNYRAPKRRATRWRSFMKIRRWGFRDAIARFFQLLSRVLSWNFRLDDSKKF